MSKLYDDLKRKGSEDDFDSLDLFAYAAAKKKRAGPPPPSPPSTKREPVSDEKPFDQATPPTQPAVAEIKDALSSHEPMMSSRSAHAALARPIRGQSPRPIENRRPRFIAVAAIGGLLVVAFLAISILYGLSRAKPTEMPARLLEPSLEPSEEEVQKPAEIKPVSQEIQPVITPAAKPLDLGGKGVMVTLESDEKVVYFEAGLFVSGAILTREGESMLSTIGQQLAPHAHHVAITVIGCTDNMAVSGVKEYKDNQSLGLLRAVAAMRILQSSSGIPPAAFKTISYGVKWSPYPNDTAANRARNRTIVLRVTQI